MQRLVVRRWFVRLVLPAVFAVAMFLASAGSTSSVAAYAYPYCGPATGPCFYGGYGYPYGGYPYVGSYVTPYIANPYIATPYVAPYVYPNVYNYYAGYPYAGYYWYR